MIVHSTETLSKNLLDFKRPELQQTPWLICGISSTENEVVFKPDGDQTQLLFTDCIHRGVDAICAEAKYFINRPEIRVFTDSNVIKIFFFQRFINLKFHD